MTIVIPALIIPKSAIGVSDELYKDGLLYTKSVSTAGVSIDITLEAARCDFVAFFGINGSSIDIVHKVSGAVVKTKSIPLYGNPLGFYDYFFAPAEQISEVSSDFAIALSNSELSFKITPYSNQTAALGLVAIGQKRFIGRTVIGLKEGVLDFSKIIRSEIDGSVNVYKGNYSKRASLDVEVAQKDRARIKALLTQLRGQICLFIPNEGAADTAIYGLLKSWEVITENRDFCALSIEIEGIT